MKLFHITAILVVSSCLFNPSTPVQAHTEKHANISGVSPAPNCGVRAVLIMAQVLGRPADDSQQHILCNRYPNERVSLLDVKGAAAELDLTLQGKRLTLQELQDRSRLAIISLKDHFVFVDRVTSDWVRVFESTVPVLQPRREFEQLYTGMALVYEPDVTTGLLSVENPIIDMKNVAFNTPSIRAQTVIRNIGKDVVYINSLTTTCSCTVASSYPKEVAPGASFVMEFKVTPPPLGRIDAAVSINSDAQRPQEWIHFTGEVDSVARLFPPQLLFDDVPVGRVMQRSVELLDESGVLGASLFVESSSPLVKAETKREASSISRKVVVTLSDAIPPGVLKETVFIKDSQGKTRLVLPIKALIVSDLALQPEKMFVGDMPPHEQETKTVVVRSRTNKPFQISNIICEDQRLQIVADTKVMAGAHAVEIHIDTLAPGQIIDTSLRIQTTDGRMCILPIYAQAAFIGAIPQPKIAVGQPAPNFSIIDATGVSRQLSDLRGAKNLLLTFFPQCFTGGCAGQLTSLQSELHNFTQNNTKIWAVSVDPANGDNGQRAFIARLGLSFPLLPDTNRAICRLYGAARTDNDLASRMSVLIDKSGIVRWVDTHVHVQTHGADVLTKMRELEMVK